jgi:chromosomal replication initiator protein
VTIEDFNSKSKKREIVQARQLAMYFARKLTELSLDVIGNQCGRRNHATVVHAIKTIENLLDTDKQFRALANEIEKKIC